MMAAPPPPPDPLPLNTFSLVRTHGQIPQIRYDIRTVVLGPFVYVMLMVREPLCGYQNYRSRPILYRLHMGSLHWTQLILWPEPPSDTFGSDFTLSSTEDGGALVRIDHSGQYGSNHSYDRKPARVHVLVVSCEQDLVHWQTLNCTGEVPRLYRWDMVTNLSGNRAFAVSQGHRLVNQLSVSLSADKSNPHTTLYSAHWTQSTHEVDDDTWTPPDWESGGAWDSRRMAVYKEQEQEWFILIGGDDSGYGSYMTLEQLYCFDIKKNQWVQPWQTEPDPVNGYPAPRSGHSVLNNGDHVLVSGGVNERDATDDLWSLNLKSRRWQQLTTFIPWETDQIAILFPETFCLSQQGEVWAFGDSGNRVGGNRIVTVCRAKLRLCSLVECAVRALLTARPSLADAPGDHLLLDVKVPRNLLPLVNHHNPVPPKRTSQHLARFHQMQAPSQGHLIMHMDAQLDSDEIEVLIHCDT